jgi:hypothetical protein
MDPFTIIAAAVAAGAVSGLTGAASDAVKDAYHGLVRVIKDVYSRHQKVVDTVERLAKKPDDKSLRTSLEGELKEAGQEVDSRLIDAAHAVIASVRRDNPQAVQAIGMDIGEFEAAELHIKNLQAPEKGIGLRAEKLSIKGTATFDNIGGASPPKT